MAPEFARAALAHSVTEYGYRVILSQLADGTALVDRPSTCEERFRSRRPNGLACGNVLAQTLRAEAAGAWGPLRWQPTRGNAGYGLYCNGLVSLSWKSCVAILVHGFYQVHQVTVPNIVSAQLFRNSRRVLTQPPSTVRP